MSSLTLPTTAVCSRMYEQIVSARTDKAGRWELKGDGGFMMFSGNLVVHKAGCPAVVLLKAQGEGGYDLVLPSRGGALEVRPLRDGKTLPNAAVKIARDDGPHLYSPIYVGSATARSAKSWRPSCRLWQRRTRKGLPTSSICHRHLSDLRDRR